MRNRMLLFGFLFLVLRPSLAAVGTGTATATLITPITIAATQALSFGRLDATGGGTIVISTAGVRTKTGALTLVTTGSTNTQALFNITGTANSTYAITLPAAAVTLTSGANTMSVGTFTSNPTGTGTLSATGTQTINVGATLTVGAAQAAGTYSGTFSVTVNYN
jgi:hypothetical protein